jgi:hypothetical protein
MNSRDVNKQIRTEIWPLLKDRGFGIFTFRSAWRHSAYQIDVVNFQSFNSYLAEGIGSTTYSFALNLGCYITVVPPESGIQPFKSKAGNLLPPEYGCHFRKQLRKTIKQPELTRDDVWYVDPDGIYLRATMEDARQIMTVEGLPWFEQFTDLRYVYELLLGDEHYVNGTWGFGAKGSPKRNYLTGYVALTLEDYNTAAQALEAALNSPSYVGVRQHHEESLALAKAHATRT